MSLKLARWNGQLISTFWNNRRKVTQYFYTTDNNTKSCTKTRHPDAEWSTLKCQIRVPDQVISQKANLDLNCKLTRAQNDTNLVERRFEFPKCKNRNESKWCILNAICMLHMYQEFNIGLFFNFCFYNSLFFVLRLTYTKLALARYTETTAFVQLFAKCPVFLSVFMKGLLAS